MPDCRRCGLPTASIPEGGICWYCERFGLETIIAYRCNGCGYMLVMQSTDTCTDPPGDSDCDKCDRDAGFSRVRFMVPVLVDGPAGPSSRAVEDPDETVRKRCDSIAASVSGMRKKLDDVEHFAESARKNCAGTGHAQVAKCSVDDTAPHIIRLKDNIRALDEVFEGREWDLENCGPVEGGA